MKRFTLKRRQFLRSAVGLGLLAVPVSASLGALHRRRVAASPLSKQQSAVIEGITIPATFQITLEGTTETGEFQSLPAALELSPPQPGDPNPILVALYMTGQAASDPVNGSIFWQSFTPGQSEHFSQITIANSQIQMQVSPSDNTLRSDVMWFTQITGTLAELMAGSGGSTRSAAMPTAGTLNLTINGDRVAGEMQLSGQTDLGVSSTYEARFSGQRQ